MKACNFLPSAIKLSVFDLCEARPWVNWLSRLFHVGWIHESFSLANILHQAYAQSFFFSISKVGKVVSMPFNYLKYKKKCELPISVTMNSGAWAGRPDILIYEPFVKITLKRRVQRECWIRNWAIFQQSWRITGTIVEIRKDSEEPFWELMNLMF